MILLDNSQIILASIFQSLKDNQTFNDDFVRHMVLNSYRMFKKRFSSEYGDLVICNDSGSCWRKNIFPYYKQNRKNRQRSSTVDWSQIYQSLNLIRNEVIEVLPYKNVKIDGAEADDVIAIITRHHHNFEDILIISNDKDFQQLQVYPNVKQYSTFKKDFVVCDNPSLFLYEHIMTGDVGDGIPNVLSDDSCIVDPDKRQSRLTKKLRHEILSNINTIESSTYATNWKRNKTLIDFSEIPQDIENNILDLYNQKVETKTSILDYMISHKLNNLIECVGEF